MFIPPSHRASARASVVFALIVAAAGCSGDDKKTDAKDAGPAPVGTSATAKKPAPGKPPSNLSPQ